MLQRYFSAFLLTGLILISTLHAVTTDSDEKHNIAITIKAPPIAEDGEQISITISVENVPQHRYVESIRIYVCSIGFHPVARYSFSKGVKPYISARIKMQKTDRIFAVATLDDGQQVISSRKCTIAIGGSDGGASSPSTESGPVSWDKGLPPGRIIPGATTPVTQLVTESTEYQDYEDTWQQSVLPYNKSRLISQSGNELPITSSRADVKIVGDHARILIDLSFYNSLPDSQEGEFQIRLPENATVYYLAFGEEVYVDKTIDTKEITTIPGNNTGFNNNELSYQREQHPAVLREAVMTDRTSARNAYETIVYGGRDPALVEWQGAGIYTINIFPILPRQTHRLVIAYDMPLPYDPSKGYQFQFSNPNSDSQTDFFIDINNKTVEHIYNMSHQPVKALNKGESTLFQYTLEPDKDLSITFSATGINLYYGEDQHGNTYFRYYLGVLPIKYIHDTSRNKHAIFALDTSARSGQNNFNYEVMQLLAILAKNEDSIKYFNVLFFDVGTHWWQQEFIANTYENRQALSQYINTISLAGATDLQRAVTEISTPNWLANNYSTNQYDVFLFTNGIASWGDTNPASIIQSIDNIRIDAIFSYSQKSTPGAMRLLEEMAELTGGGNFIYNLYPYDKFYNHDPVTTAHRYTRWRLIDIQIEGTTDIIAEDASYYLYNNKNLVIVGRGKPTSNLITLTYASASTPEQKHTTTLMRRQVFEASTDLAPRMYGRAAVTLLEDTDLTLPNNNITYSYAHYFRVPRKSLSLVMLENHDDYQRFSINHLADYSGVVTNNPVSTYINSHNYNPSYNFVLTDSPQDQHDLFNIFAYRVSVCKLPDTLFKDKSLNQLRKLPVIQREKYYLTSEALTFDYSKLTNSSYETALEQLTPLGLSKDQSDTIVLRYLTSQFENNYIDIEQRFEFSTELKQLGKINDSYFFVLQTITSVTDNRMYLLAASLLKQQGHDLLAEFIEQLVKIDVGGSRMALEPY